MSDLMEKIRETDQKRRDTGRQFVDGKLPGRAAKAERGLKIVFWVEDVATKEILVEKQQSIIALGDNQASSVTIQGLARDHAAETMAALERLKDKTGPMSDAEKAELQEISQGQNCLDEFFMAAGDLIGRFIRLKLRDWARKKIG